MASLEEIAEALRPQWATVSVSGMELKIRGLSSGELADVFSRHPEFAQFMNETRKFGADAENDEDRKKAILANVDIPKALGFGGGAFPAIIAAAIGKHGDSKAIQTARGLPIDVQQEIVGTAIALSFPEPPKNDVGGTPQPPNSQES